MNVTPESLMMGDKDRSEKSKKMRLNKDYLLFDEKEERDGRVSLRKGNCNAHNL